MLPGRVADYAPGAARRADRRRRGGVVGRRRRCPATTAGWSLAPAETAPLLLPGRPTITMTTRCTRRCSTALAGGGALFFRSPGRAIAAHGDDVGRADRRPASPRRSGTWSGPGASPTTPWPRCAPCSARRPAAHAGRHAPARPGRPRRARAGRVGRAALPPRSGPPTVGGRWSRAARAASRTRPGALHAAAEALLDRYGVVTRGAVAAERVPGGFRRVYPVLQAFEESGRCRRGYFVEGLGAAQFALPGRGRPDARDGRARRRTRTSADRCRAAPARRERACLAARPTRPTPTAPRCPGPPGPTRRRAGTGRAARPGHWSCSSTASCVLYVERGGRTLLSWTGEPARLDPAADALAVAVRDGALGRLPVERADGAAFRTRRWAGRSRRRASGRPRAGCGCAAKSVGQQPARPTESRHRRPANGSVQNSSTLGPGRRTELVTAMQRSVDRIYPETTRGSCGPRRGPGRGSAAGHGRLW